MAQHIYTWEPGRIIARDGAPLLRLARVESSPGNYNLSPPEANELARRIVALLNKLGERDPN